MKVTGSNKSKYLFLYNKLLDAIAKNKREIVVMHFPSLVPFLKDLTNKGILRGHELILWVSPITKKKHYYVKIYFKSDCQSRPILGLLEIGNIGTSQKYCSVFEIKALMYHHPTTIMVFSTRKGLLTHTACIAKNIGGESVFVIYP